MRPLGTSSHIYKEEAIKLTPFLKWAGGKRWLSANYPQIYPIQYNRYVEPFLGGGATFFYLMPNCAILSDLNSQLIMTYQAIRDDWKAVQEALKRHQRKHSSHYYYEERHRKRFSIIERAAQFLYLNRTCWNGLYRVNLQGKFNVPIGTKNSVILPTDNFQAISSVLTSAKLLPSDFEAVIDSTKCGDFLFVDPPYTVKHNINGFAKYNERIFSWDDQVRLASSIQRAAARNVQILVTNADHSSIRNLYSNTGDFVRLNRYSVISSTNSSRGKTTELAIVINYRIIET